MSRARSWVSQVKPSPIARQVTSSGNRASTSRSPVPQAPLTNCTTPTRMPWPMQRNTMPKAAVDLPLPAPVWTIKRPRSSVLVASTLRRAACRRCIFSLCSWLISSSLSVGSLMCRSHQLGTDAVALRPPQSALDRLAEPRAGLGQRRRVAGGHELADCRIADVRLVKRVEMRVVHRPRGRGESEEVIDRGGDLGRPLVAVPHDPGDPARVGGAAAHHPADLLAQAADTRPVGLGVIVVVDRRRASREVPHRQRQPALELVVIIAVEQIVLAIVLVVQHRLGLGEPRFEQVTLRPALAAGAVGPLAPAELQIGKVALVIPDALVA